MMSLLQGSFGRAGRYSRCKRKTVVKRLKALDKVRAVLMGRIGVELSVKREPATNQASGQ
jgi:hypothetical protein